MTLENILRFAVSNRNYSCTDMNNAPDAGIGGFPFGENVDDDLVFILFDAEESYTAIEGRFGLVAFGDTMEGLQAAIIERVNEYFGGRYEGNIRIRQFTDTVISV